MNSRRMKNEEEAEPEKGGETLGMDLGVGVNLDAVLSKGNLKEEKWRPIHWAASKGHDDVIQVIVNHGGDVNAVTTPCGFSAMHIAAKHGRISTIYTLARYYFFFFSLEMRIERYFPESLTLFLLSAVPSNRLGGDIFLESSASERASQPIHVAAREGMCDVLNALVALGVDIDTPLSTGRTSVQIAAASGKSEVVEKLIQLGCDLCEKKEDRKESLWALSTCAKGTRAHKIITSLRGAIVKGESECDLSNCGLSTIPECLRSCPRLNVIHLQNNQIKFIPPILFEMPFIQRVDLTGIQSVCGSEEEKEGRESESRERIAFADGVHE